MGFLDLLKSNTVSAIGKVIDSVNTTDGEKSEAKRKLTETVMNSLGQVAGYQRDVLVTEMKGNWLQKSWRPLLMLTFGIIIVMKWFGVTDANISEQLELELLGIIKLGLGGYVVGRSVEKVSDTVTKNIDMPFLKRKERHQP